MGFLTSYGLSSTVLTQHRPRSPRASRFLTSHHLPQRNSSPSHPPSTPRSLTIQLNPLLLLQLLFGNSGGGFLHTTKRTTFQLYLVHSMRLLWSLAAVAVTASAVAAFAPCQNQGAVVARASSALHQVVAAADVKAKNEATLEMLKAKDAGSHAISKDVSLVASFHLKLVHIT